MNRYMLINEIIKLLENASIEKLKFILTFLK